MWVKRNTELCTFCTETKESLVHIFWEYNHVRKFWLVIVNILKKCRALILEDGLEFMKYAINIEKASMIYLSPVQKEYVKRKCLDLEAALSG
jgi:hypothetical protein